MSYLMQNFYLPFFSLPLSTKLKLIIASNNVPKLFYLFKIRYFFLRFPNLLFTLFTFHFFCYNVFFYNKVFLIDKKFLLNFSFHYITKFNKVLSLKSLTTLNKLFTYKRIHPFALFFETELIDNAYFLSSRIVLLSLHNSAFKTFFLWLVFSLSFLWLDCPLVLKFNSFYFFYNDAMNFFLFNNKGFFKIMNL